MADVAPRRVLITGGPRGIGAGLAAAFAVGGRAIGLIGKGASRLAAAAERLRGSAAVVWRVANVGDRERLQGAIGEIVSELSGPGALINNVGLARWVRLDTPLATAEQLWDEVLRTNLGGAFLASLAAIPHLAQPGGQIINTSSEFPPAVRAQVLRETPPGRVGEVADVVATVRYLASPAASFVTGELLHVNGGRIFGR